MARCETCGNDYDRPIAITLNGESHLFDSFECAIHALAPTCGRCGVRVLGHGVQDAAHIYCGASCARGAGAKGFVDHV
jgi:hypothetical protein